jgi:hypothetical protein
LSHHRTNSFQELFPPTYHPVFHYLSWVPGSRGALLATLQLCFSAAARDSQSQVNVSTRVCPSPDLGLCDPMSIWPKPPPRACEGLFPRSKVSVCLRDGCLLNWSLGKAV